ncbi:MAG: hypothetical protein V3U14_12830 [candidate division NC10 bacterium]
MQLSAIRTEILDAAGLASDDVRFGTATLNRMINRALRSVSKEHDWPWLQSSGTITTVADQTAYTQASPWRKTIRLSYQSTSLQQIGPLEAPNYFDLTSKNPTVYYMEEQQVHLLPTPNAVFSVDHSFLTFEVALSGDTDEPALPDDYMDMLFARALMLVAIKLRDSELYNLAGEDWKLWIRRTADDVMQSKGPLKLTVRRGFPF